jgi:putative membrane-bound dehydrogenase-like protein
MPRFAAVLLVLVTLTNTAPAQNAALPPDKAPAQMKVPDGFRVTLFAGEPDVVKPIAMTTDDRGRLWVVESHSYPHWITDGKEGHDRVLIFADNKGTGHFDSCKIFLDNGTNLSGIAIGHGGVWLCSTPNLLFIPVKDGEDKPAGKPVVALDGWDVKKAQHNVFNDLVWGPDGWLYGCNGIQSNSRVGRGRRTRSAFRSTVASGATTRPSSGSRSSPPALPTRGAWTSTTTARCSSPTASSNICSMSCRARTTSACMAKT